MHTEQKVWSNWSFRQQNYLNYPTIFRNNVVIFGTCPLVGPPFCGGPCSTEHAEHASTRLCVPPSTELVAFSPALESSLRRRRSAVHRTSSASFFFLEKAKRLDSETTRRVTSRRPPALLSGHVRGDRNSLMHLGRTRNSVDILRDKLGL